jgi:hypothetical protein
MMHPEWLLRLMFPVAGSLFGLYFVGIGLRGLIGRRPFLLSTSWMLGGMLLILALPLVHSLLDLAAGRPVLGLGSSGWLLPVMFVAVAFQLALSLRGYLAFGVTDASFREALLAVLADLQLPHEESLSVLRLPSVGTELQVAVGASIGTAQIKVKRGGQRGLLRKIAKGMNEHYRHNAVPTNLTCCALYVVMGSVLVAIMVRMLL